MSQARIGKIRLKAGGAEVRVLDRQAVNPNGENWQGGVITAARSIAGYSEPGCELCAYVVVGLYSNGSHSVGWRYDGEKCPVSRRLLPALVAEVIREDIITEAAIKRAQEV